MPQVAELEDFLFGGTAAVFDVKADVSDDEEDAVNIRDLVQVRIIAIDEAWVQVYDGHLLTGWVRAGSWQGTFRRCR